MGSTINRCFARLREVGNNRCEGSAPSSRRFPQIGAELHLGRRSLGFFDGPGGRFAHRGQGSGGKRRSRGRRVTGRSKALDASERNWRWFGRALIEWAQQPGGSRRRRRTVIVFGGPWKVYTRSHHCSAEATSPHRRARSGVAENVFAKGKDSSKPAWGAGHFHCFHGLCPSRQGAPPDMSDASAAPALTALTLAVSDSPQMPSWAS